MNLEIIHFSIDQEIVFQMSRWLRAKRVQSSEFEFSPNSELRPELPYPVTERPYGFCGGEGFWWPEVCGSSLKFLLRFRFSRNPMFLNHGLNGSCGEHGFLFVVVKISSSATFIMVTASAGYFGLTCQWFRSIITGNGAVRNGKIIQTITKTLEEKRKQFQQLKKKSSARSRKRKSS